MLHSRCYNINDHILVYPKIFHIISTYLMLYSLSHNMCKMKLCIYTSVLDQRNEKSQNKFSIICRKYTIHLLSSSYPLYISLYYKDIIIVYKSSYKYSLHSSLCLFFRLRIGCLLGKRLYIWKNLAVELCLGFFFSLIKICQTIGHLRIEIQDSFD